MTVFNSAYAAGYDDLYQEKSYVAECDLIEQAIRLLGVSNAREVLDVGCGTGGHAIELARRGYSVSGVDLSRSMIDLAVKKSESSLGPDERPTFTQGDARTFQLGAAQFDVAVMMFAVIGYLNLNEDVIAALRNIAKHLKKGGIFACDFWWGPAVLTQRPGERVRLVPTNKGKLLRATNTTLNTLSCTAEVNFTLFHFNEGGAVSETKEVHRMRYFFGPEVEMLFDAAGLKLEILGKFPEIAQAPTDSSWNAIAVGRKK